jgi:hypothetical protein
VLAAKGGVNLVDLVDGSPYLSIFIYLIAIYVIELVYM